MTVHRTVFSAAAACLLLAAGYTVAQAPPASPDADQRLKALEDKMDKVLKLLEGRAPAVPGEALDKQIRLLTEARDTLVTRFEDAQQKLMDFRLRTPVPADNAVAKTIDAQRLLKDDAILQDLRQRQAEVSARMAMVKNVGDVEKDARALLVLLQRRGVDVDLLRRTAGVRRNDEIPTVELVRLYGASLRHEAEENQALLDAAIQRMNRDSRLARVLIQYEVQEERLRSTRDQTQKLLDALVGQLNRIDVMRSFQPK